ncbi:GH3 domain-containing protein isoform X2 [Monodelphis domestica]|uniref:GH3 domain-containing protein isoform X2 n=1 Tax=Monodelphis domestica TaxID=13616 RepID=UPI0024E244DD|nr:GH3 domain-containing protein isoform X2 [Monodelphis domestica]
MLLLLLLLPLTLLWMGKAWGPTLQHGLALRALRWAAAWKQWQLEKSTRHALRSQEQALHQCLQGPRTTPCRLGEVPDLNSFRNQFPLVWPRLDPHMETGESEEGLALLRNPLSSSAPWDSSFQVARGNATGHTAESQLPGTVIPGGPRPRRHCPFDPLFPLAQLPPLAPEAPDLGLPAWDRSGRPSDPASGSSRNQEAAGVIGLNLGQKQLNPGYLLLPGPPFVELLPAWEKVQEEGPATLLLGEALQGKEYELVLTNDASLTRCPLGDVVQVIGFYNQCPVVRFVRRLGQSLNVRGEGISEDVFSEVLLRAVGLWPGAKLLDYCCAESGIVGSSSDGSAPHYEVFVELRGVRGLSEDHRHKLDHCLQEASPIYKSLRFRGSIGPAQVHLVGQGGFSALRALLSSSPSLMPFSSFPPEMPRILRHRKLIQFLLRKVVS